MTLVATTVVGKDFDGKDFEVELVPDPDPDNYIRSRYNVMLDGKLIGMVFRRLFTRETGPKRRRYVSKRWQSYGWAYASGFGSYIGLEQPTRKRAIEHLVTRARKNGE